MGGKLHVNHIGIIVDVLDNAVGMSRTLFGAAPAVEKEMPKHGLRVVNSRPPT